MASIFTVSQLNHYVKSLLDRDGYLSHVTVKGELSNFKQHSSGHLYFALKDEGAVVRGVMFRTAAQRLAFQPESGQKVIATGRASVFERDGQFQLYVEEMQPDGVGALYIAYEQRKQKLEAEGLFDPQRKKPIPPFPQRIGVITSPTGAAVRDILQVLKRRYRLADVWLYPVLVQGPGAAAELAEALEYFDRTQSVDVILIGRGGGSIEDLWAFNEEVVARAIGACGIPVISAVGHETDFTIADFVADLRAPTPSAAAELAVPSQRELEERLGLSLLRLRRAYDSGLQQKRARLERCRSSRVFVSPQDRLDQYRQQLDLGVRDLQHAMEQQLSQCRERLSRQAVQLDALSPLGVLKRGYAVAEKADGSVLRSVGEVQVGQAVSIRLEDGRLSCQVTGKEGEA